MAITSQVSQFLFTGNGSTSTPYALTDLRFDDEAWLTVERIGADRSVTPLAAGVDYTITGDGTTGSGNIVTGGGAIPAEAYLRVSRNTPLVQETSLVANGQIPSATLERMADWRVMGMIDLKRRQEEALKRSLRVPDAEVLLPEESESFELAPTAERSGRYLGFDDEGEVTLKTTTEIAAQFGGDLGGVVAAAEAAQEAAASSADAAALSSASASASAGAAASSAASLIPINADAQNMWWAHKALRAFDSAAPALGTYFGVIGFGDSLAMRPTRYLIEELVSRIGLGALCAYPLTSSLESSYLLSRTLSSAVDATVTGYWPTNAFIDISSGGYAEFSVPSTGRFRSGWRKITIPVALRASGGDVVLTVVQNGSTTVNKTISGVGSVGSMAMFEATEADGLKPGVDPVIRVAASGGAVYIGGACLWRDRGVVPIQLARGGDTLSSQNTAPTANLTLIKNTFAPALMVHHMYEEDTSGSATQTHFSRMATYFPTTTHLVISGMPNAGGSVVNPSVVRGLAKNANFAFIDAFEMFGSYANLVALNWFGDGVHLSEEAYIYDLYCIYSALPFLAPVENIRARMKRRAVGIVNQTFRQPMIYNAVLYKSISNGSINDTGHPSSPGARALFVVNGTAAGYASGMIMAPVSRSNQLDVGHPFTLHTRIQGITLNAGVNIWCQIGASFATHNAPDKTVKTIGWEIERPVDHGYTGGLGNFAIRLFAYDGSTLHEGPWATTGWFTTTDAHNLYMRYEAGKLSLLGSSDNLAAQPLIELTSLRVTLASGALASPVHMGIQTSGAASGHVALVDANFFPVITADVEPWAV